MSAVAARLAEVRARLRAAASAAGRDPDSVRLLAVSKSFPAERVREAIAAGQRCFGENRVQEATRKIPELAGEAGLDWHLVGQLQRNKARRAVELFDWIHSVDRPELARALDRHATALGRRPRVLLQVDLDDEPQKGGVPPAELAALAAEVDALPGLELEGLMTIPRPCDDAEQLRPCFARLRGLLEELSRGREHALTELSMGMSADFEVAVAEGATWVRIGTRVFGEREKR